MGAIAATLLLHALAAAGTGAAAGGIAGYITWGRRAVGVAKFLAAAKRRSEDRSGWSDAKRLKVEQLEFQINQNRAYTALFFGD